MSINRESVKKEVKPYLRQQYTTNDQMICQICKEELPFRISDGNYYFEAVEFLAGLKKHHFQNYLALCPNHAAMFLHANDVKDDLLEMFVDLVGEEFEVVLAGEDASIYFTRTHIEDLKAIMASEELDS